MTEARVYIRCQYCQKRPRSKMEGRNAEHYAPFCSYQCQQYLALAMGWKRIRDADGNSAWQVGPAGWVTWHCFPWSKSIDAQQAPGGPEDLARGRGWRIFGLSEYDNGLTIKWWRRSGGDIRIDVVGRPEARLRCEALTLALESGEGKQP